ncbi:MAG: protein kinase [Anaerolineales bacterium]|nr:protein kinase [Anaerolineales bacterium]
MDSIEFDRPGGDDEGGAGDGHGLTNLSGKQIGRYLLGQPLGSGGAATVYRAYDQVQGITVALKLLLPGADEKSYSRFRREATLAGALRHPHIVRILQIGVAPKGEVAYIAMELVEGDSLAELLSQRGRLRPEETANLLEPIARTRLRPS